VPWTNFSLPADAQPLDLFAHITLLGLPSPACNGADNPAVDVPNSSGNCSQSEKELLACAQINPAHLPAAALESKSALVE
jgi:hypothetical protein